MPLDVLLADDRKSARDGIKAILSRADDFRVVGEAENGADAVEFTKRLRPHMVLMNGVETIQEILSFHGGCKIVILSMYDDENSVIAAIRAGARAFILERTSNADLLEALRIVADGGIYLSPLVSGRLLSRIRKGGTEARLSPRELQVMRLVADGKTTKQIARLLNVSEQTVRSYCKTKTRKLRVKAGNALAICRKVFRSIFRGRRGGGGQGPH